MALRKTFINQDGNTISGYYRVREVNTQYEKDKDQNLTLNTHFIVEVFDNDTGNEIFDKLVPSSGQGAQNRLTEPYTRWTPEGCGVYTLGVTGVLPDSEPVQSLVDRAYEHLKTLDHCSDAIDC